MTPRTPSSAVSRRDLLKWTGAAAATGLALGGSTGRQRARAAAGRQDPYAAPPSDTEATLTISNWGDPNDQKVYEAVAGRFKQKFPNVTLNDNFTPITTWTDYVNKLVTQVAAGDAPDVINIAIEGFRFGVDKELFMPLDDFLANDPAGQELVADVDPRLVEAFKLDGQTYLAPYSWNNMMIHYNTKMYADAGIERPSDDWTWSDFLETAKALTTGDVHGFAVPFFNFGLSPWWFSNDTAQLTADLSEPNLTDPKMIEAVTFVRDLVHVHKVAPSVEGSEPYQLFPAGKVAMTGAGRWVVGSFRDLGFQDFDVVPWPQNRRKATVFGVAGFAIYPETEHPELAWEYIKEIASTETANAFVAIGAANPARRSVASSAEFLASPPHASLFYESLEYAQPVQAPPRFTDLETIFMRHMGDVMSGAAEPEEAMEAAQEELATALQD